MREGHGTTLLGGLLIAVCPLLCVGLPLLIAAGIGAGLALAVGGAVLGGAAFAALAVGAFLALRRGSGRRRSVERRCTPLEHADLREPGESSVAVDRLLAEVTKG